MLLSGGTSNVFRKSSSVLQRMMIGLIIHLSSVDKAHRGIADTPPFPLRTCPTSSPSYVSNAARNSPTNDFSTPASASACLSPSFCADEPGKTENCCTCASDKGNELGFDGYCENQECHEDIDRHEDVV